MSKFFTDGWSDFTTTLKRAKIIFREPFWWFLLCLTGFINWIFGASLFEIAVVMATMHIAPFLAFYNVLLEEREEKRDRALQSAFRLN